MCCKRCGRAPRHVRQGAIGASLIGLLVVLAGCASDRNAPHASTSATTPMHMAGAPVEADGLPAQIAPPRNGAPLEDDPREPWSPNYGSVRPTRTSAIDTRTETAVVAMPPPVRAIAVSHTRPADAEDIIRRAVAAHEMRQPY